MQEEQGKLFANIRDQLGQRGYINEEFNFVDASHLVSKAAVWQERDNSSPMQAMPMGLNTSGPKQGPVYTDKG